MLLLCQDPNSAMAHIWCRSHSSLSDLFRHTQAAYPAVSLQAVLCYRPQQAYTKLRDLSWGRESHCRMSPEPEAFRVMLQTASQGCP